MLVFGGGSGGGLSLALAGEFSKICEPSILTSPPIAIDAPGVVKTTVPPAIAACAPSDFRLSPSSDTDNLPVPPLIDNEGASNSMPLAVMRIVLFPQRKT